MSNFSFSLKAQRDVREITHYTKGLWGKEQMHRYIDALEKQVRLIADNPAIGKSCEDILSHTRCFLFQRHIIYYRKVNDGIEILRILHVSMQPQKQFTTQHGNH
jgi:toxin ParE1/3/4